MGWKIDPSLPAGVKKCVILMAPHTSNWDYVIGMMAFWGVYKIDLKQLIKSDLFFFPLGWLLKGMGGVPVYRNKKTNMTTTIANMYKDVDELTITFTPEGTRSYNAEWKKGFYYIALEAKVPIYMGYLDYQKKEGAIFPDPIIPSGNVEEDILKIKSLYKNISGRYPDQGVR